MNSGTLKPFAKKSFYLDLKGYPLELKLAKDLKLLGGKQETFLSKDVSFVVSNRISGKMNSVSSINSWSNCAPVSPHLFNESTWDCIDSPTNISASNLDSNFTQPVSRGMSLVQKARLKAGINHQTVKHGTADILENCKLWNIKVYDVKKVLSWVEKYKNLYHKKYAAELKEQQKKLKTNNENVKKLRTPYIKVDDCKRQYQSRYKEVLYSADMLNILAKVKEICTGNKVSKKPPRSILQELNKPTQFTQPKAVQSLSVSASITSLCPPASNCIYASNTKKDMKLNPALKRKGKDCKKKRKKLYCEICEVYFCDLDEHLATKQHETFMKNGTHYEAITEIISKFSSVPQFSCFGKNMVPNNFLAPIKGKLHSNNKHNCPKLDLPLLKTEEKQIIHKENQLSAQALDTEKSYEQTITLQTANTQGCTDYSAIADFNGKVPAVEGFCDQKMPEAFNEVDLLCKESLNFTESEPLSFHAPTEQCHLLNITNMATEVSNVTTLTVDYKTLNSVTVDREPLLEDANFCEPLVHSVEALNVTEFGRKSFDVFACYENSVLIDGFNSLGCNTLFNADNPEAALQKNLIGMEMQMTNEASFENELENVEYAQKIITGVSIFSDAKKMENQVLNSLGIVSTDNISMLVNQIENQILIQTSESNIILEEPSNAIATAEREPEIIFPNTCDKGVGNLVSSNVEVEMDGLVPPNHPHQSVCKEDNNQSRKEILLTDNETDADKNINEFKEDVSNVVFPLPVLVDNTSVENVLLQNEAIAMPLLEAELERDENKEKCEDTDMPKLQLCCDLKDGEDNKMEIVNEVDSECGTELYNVNDDIVSASYSSDDDTGLSYLEDTSGMLEACELEHGNKISRKNKNISLAEKSKCSFKTVALQQKKSINENLFFGVENKSLRSPTNEEQNDCSARVQEEHIDHAFQSAVSFNCSIMDQNTAQAMENNEYCSRKENEKNEYPSKDAKLVEKNNSDGRNDVLEGSLLNQQQAVSPLQSLNLLAETEAKDGNLNQNIADFPSQVYKSCCSKELDSSNHIENDLDVSGQHKSSSSFEEVLIHFQRNKLNVNGIEQVALDSAAIENSVNKEQTGSSSTAELLTKAEISDKISNFSMSHENICELSASAKNSPTKEIDPNINFQNCPVDSHLLPSNLSEKKLCNHENQKLCGSYNTILFSHETDKLPNEHSLHGEQSLSSSESPNNESLDRINLNQNSIQEKTDNFTGQSDFGFLIHETENSVHKVLSPTDDSCYLSASDGCLNLSKNLDSSKCVQTCSLSVSMPFCAKNDDSSNVIEADFNSDFEEDEEWLEIQSDIDSACKSLGEETDTYAIDLSMSHEKLNEVPALLQC